MKAFLLSIVLLVAVSSPVFAATSIYDTDLASEYQDSTASATISATPKPTTAPRMVTTSTAKTPVSGAVENTIMLLAGGLICMIVGLKFSRA